MVATLHQFQGVDRYEKLNRFIARTTIIPTAAGTYILNRSSNRTAVIDKIVLQGQAHLANPSYIFFRITDGASNQDGALHIRGASGFAAHFAETFDNIRIVVPAGFGVQIWSSSATSGTGAGDLTFNAQLHGYWLNVEEARSLQIQDHNYFRGIASRTAGVTIANTLLLAGVAGKQLMIEGLIARMQRDPGLTGPNEFRLKFGDGATFHQIHSWFIDDLANIGDDYVDKTFMNRTKIIGPTGFGLYYEHVYGGVQESTFSMLSWGRYLLDGFIRDATGAVS